MARLVVDRNMNIESGYIYLRKLRFHAFHGVLPQERVIGNDYEVSVRIGYPVAKAVDSDSVSDTPNYADVYNIIRCKMAEPAALIECVAGNIVKELLVEFPKIKSIDIELTKLNPPMGADCVGAGVELHIKNN